MRLTDLYGMRVVDGMGRAQGRVCELHIADGEVTHVGIGPLSLLHRFTGGRGGRRIAWSAVTGMKKGCLVLGDD